MASALVVYGLILLIIIVVMGLLYWRLRRFGTVRALLASCTALVVLVSLIPIPAHGSVTILAQVFYAGWQRHINHSSLTKPVVVAVTDTKSPRFASVLTFSILSESSRAWSKIVDDFGNRGWLDTSSGMIWSNWTLLDSDTEMPPLPLAKAHCARKDPAGFWALASNAEEALMWQAGGHQFLVTATTSTMSYSLDASFGIELPTYQLNSPSSNKQPATARRVYSVRCVARSTTAPPSGYFQRDIDLELWNTYQLDKLKGR